MSELHTATDVYAEVGTVDGPLTHLIKQFLVAVADIECQLGTREEIDASPVAHAEAEAGIDRQYDLLGLHCLR